MKESFENRPGGASAVSRPGGMRAAEKPGEQAVSAVDRPGEAFGAEGACWQYTTGGGGHLDLLSDMLAELDLPRDSHVMEQFAGFRRLVLRWNESVNLTAIKDPAEFERKHFMDSLSICDDPRIRQAKTIIDVGTGAGFPGIPLAIVFPDKRFILMDSLAKRMKLLREMAEEIGLKNVEIIHARAEELARKEEYRQRCDLCVSRAVANLSVLSEYCLPFVRRGGWFAAYKTAGAEEEIAAAKGAIRILGGRLADRTSGIQAVSLDVPGPGKVRRPVNPGQACPPGGPGRIPGTNDPGESLRHLILWIEKKQDTPSKYPRKAGTPAKEPLK